MLLFSIILLVVSFLIFLVSVLECKYVTLNREEISATLDVGDTPAFNITNFSLSFGTITEETTSSRMLIINNDYSFPIVASFKPEGNISRFFVFEKKIEIPPHENRTVKISAVLSKNESYGHYSGKIHVVLRREL